MKSRKRKTGIDTTMSMIELVIVTGIFAAVSIILVHFFVAAFSISDRADDISHAQIISESVMEELKGDDINNVMEAVGYSESSNGIYTGNYTRKWKICPAGMEPYFSVTVSSARDDSKIEGITKVTITVKNISVDKKIYELSDDFYQ